MGTDDALDGFYAALLDDDPVELYERAPCGYLSTTPDGTITKVNGTFLTWTGYDRADLVGRKRFVDLLTVGGRIYHETHYAPMLRMEGRAKEIAVEVVCADGTRLPALVNAALERDGAGTPTVIRTAVFDASDRRAYEQELLRAKQRAEDAEREARHLVSTLQQTLIPPAPPRVPGLEVDAVFVPASAAEVGGDFYDVFELVDGDWVVVAGDVRGKGPEAAVVTALARYTIRAVAVREPEPSGVLRALNGVLQRDADRFCTVVVLRLRRSPSGWTATVAIGGHPQPLLRSADGQVRAIGRTGTLLGVFDEVAVSDVEVELADGDVVVLYTDGVSEAVVDGGLFGEVCLEGAVADLGAGGGAADLLAAVESARTGPQRDDVVVVSARVRVDA